MSNSLYMKGFFHLNTHKKEFHPQLDGTPNSFTGKGGSPLVSPMRGDLEGASLLNHDLLAVHDVDALRGVLHLAALNVVDVASILLVAIDEFNAISYIILQRDGLGAA